MVICLRKKPLLKAFTPIKLRRLTRELRRCLRKMQDNERRWRRLFLQEPASQMLTMTTILGPLANGASCLCQPLTRRVALMSLNRALLRVQPVRPARLRHPPLAPRRLLQVRPRLFQGRQLAGSTLVGLTGHRTSAGRKRGRLAGSIGREAGSIGREAELLRLAPRLLGSTDDHDRYVHI